MTPTAKDIQKAKAIVGEWGYEEEYWWRPIAEAIAEERLECAKIAAWQDDNGFIACDECRDIIANEIRKRGEK